MSSENEVVLKEKLAARDAEIERLRKALIPFSNLRVTRFMVSGCKYDFRINAADIRHAKAALASLPEKTPIDDDLQSAECVRYQQARELD